jgi:hypothetical protein
LLTTLLALASLFAALAALLTLTTTSLLSTTLTVALAALLTATLILFTIVWHDFFLPLFEVFNG